MSADGESSGRKRRDEGGGGSTAGGAPGRQRAGAGRALPRTMPKTTAELGAWSGRRGGPDAGAGDGDGASADDGPAGDDQRDVDEQRDDQAEAGEPGTDPGPDAGAPAAAAGADAPAVPGGGAALESAAVDLQVQRHAAGDSNLESAAVGSVLGSVRGSSAGAPLEPGVRGSMEGSFGRSFDSVRVHDDASAAGAADSLNANAFTVGSDVYFGAGKYDPGSTAGKHLLAHELTHVAQGGGAAAHGTGAGPSVSHPGDAAEVNAEQVADAVVAGQPIPAIGSGTAAVHFDRMSDLDAASRGNWLSTDGDEVLRKVRDLNAAERRLLERDLREDLVGRIVRALNPMQMTEYFSMVHYDLRWKMYWLDQGGHLDDMSEQQWRWVIAYAGPTQMAELRTGFPRGYRLFLQNAPADLVPAWDKLEGLVTGAWTGDAQAIRTAIGHLSSAQKQTLSDRTEMKEAIFTRAGNAEEVFRVVTYLTMQLRQSVYWLNRTGAISQLSRQQWAQLLAESPKWQFDSLVTGTPDLWALVQTHCDAAIIQTVRQQTNDPAQAATSLDDQVQADALFTSLGAAAFLAVATQTDVAANYKRCQDRGKVMPVLNGLPRGIRLGEQATRNLSKWWHQGGETSIPVLERMFEVRFAVTVSGTGATTHASSTTDPVTGVVTVNTQIGAWTADGLQRGWEVCEGLPPAQVEGNPRFTHMLHNIAGSNGNAYYRERAASGEVVMGYGNAAEVAAGATLGDQVDSSAHVYWEYKRDASGNFELDPVTRQRIPLRRIHNVTTYGATVRHEIGHAVDTMLNVMGGGWQGQTSAGGWNPYGSYDSFLSAIVNDFADATWNGLSLLDMAKHLQAMKACLTGTLAYPAAWSSLWSDPPPAAPFGPLRVFWATANWTGGGTGPWYNPHLQPTGTSGRRYQRAYDGAGSLWSYVGATRDEKEITRYQWRAPGEWFAEVYQVYYAENETNPGGPVGGILRSRDATAADMMSGIVDRGFSPQDVRGAGSPQAAPGTPATGGTP